MSDRAEMKRPQEILESLVLTEPERNLLAGGFCPKCKLAIRGEFIAVEKGMHFMAPEIYVTLRERNIDTESGHKNNCELKGLRLP